MADKQATSAASRGSMAAEPKSTGSPAASASPWVTTKGTELQGAPRQRPTATTTMPAPNRAKVMISATTPALEATASGPSAPRVAASTAIVIAYPNKKAACTAAVIAVIRFVVNPETVATVLGYGRIGSEHARTPGSQSQGDDD